MPSRRTLTAAAGYLALSMLDTMLASKTSPAARRARMAVKPLLMPTLSTAFREATRGRTDALTRSTAAAQAFSWGGDVALLGRGDKAFLTGVGSFAAAHAAYIAGFTSARSASARLDDPGMKVAGGLWLATAPVMALASRRKSPEMSGPIAGYATMLSAMYATSTALDPSIPRRARRTVQAGTALFLLSDSVLGVQQFLRRTPSPALEAVVMATYTAGQGLIAAGVADARR